MKHMNKEMKFRPTATANSYLKRLKKKEVFDRAVDAYVFAAAYALKRDVNPSQVSLNDRSELVEVGILDEDVRLALEAGVHAIVKRHGKPEPKDSGSVLDLVTRYAEAGLELLKERWDGKTGVQIQDDIRKMIA